MSPTIQRVVGVALLVLAGVLSLPVSAALLDGQGTENWILPAQLLVMSIVGALVTVGLPALAPAEAPAARRAVTGVGLGIIAALLGVLVFWLLLNGLEGA